LQEYEFRHPGHAAERINRSNSSPKEPKSASMTIRNRTIILVASCVIFLMFGMLTGLLGPILPSLAQQSNTDLTLIGSLFTVVFLGTLLAQLVSGPLGDRIGMSKVVLIGMVLLASGYLGLSLSRSFPLMLGLGFVGGMGLGAVDLGASLWIATTFQDDRVSKLNLLNVFFGMGAFIGPALVSISLVAFSIALLPVWGACFVLILLLPVIFWTSRAEGFRAAVPPLAADSARREIFQFHRSPLLWILGFIFLVYVGVEIGYGGWVTTYMVRTAGMRIEDAALAASVFWLALTAGRIISTVIGAKLSAMRLLTISLVGALLAGWTLVGTSGNIAMSFVSIAAIGLFFAAIYPTLLAIITEYFPQAPGKAAGPATAMGSLGGAILPWMQGILLTQVSPLASMVFAGVNILVIVGLLVIAGVLIRRQTAKR
jgi:MFS transporter, FHS family, glucose/mannose:H+ symporter